ncbi:MULTISPECIES: ABC transporter substrate-binding protein [unclassified Ornithinimicrobium]|uniref:ABC transporter substrate-binding protein n=1 Tax=unclassified Ornithinimicrobium TaxID=2615080 RepID=UPI003854D561
MNLSRHSLLRRLALLPIAGLALTACSGDGETFDGNEAGGETEAAGGASGQLVIAQSSDILTMDPHMHRNRPTQNVIHTVFESLVNQGQDLNAVPELATEWEQVDDLTWRFQLREDVTFHNGEPFDAEDVKFSIERILDPEQASPRASMLEVIDSVEVEDEHTVLITTANPAPTLLAGLAVNEIVPSEYVAEVGDEEFASSPVGTGPFTFGDWVPNEAVTLAANEDYWGGAPSVDTLIFRPIPEVSSRMAALQSGDVQIAAEIPPDLSGELSGETEAVSVPGTRIFFLAMNVTEAPFDQLEVRVAANQAVDKQTLVDALYEGRARALDQPAFPEMVGYTEGIEGYEFDADAAAEVLGAVEGSVEIDSTESTRMLAEAVAGQLQTAGLDAQVNVVEEQAFVEGVESGASTAYVSSWGVAEGDADVIMARHFWSPSREGAFYTGYTNDALDELIVSARSTVDEGEREQLYAEAMQIVMDDAPWVPLVNPEEIYGVSTRVQGWEPSPIGRFNVAGVSLDS